MKRFVPLAIVLLALTACVRTSTVPLGAPRAHAPVPPQDVQVFLKEADVPGPFEKIALINAEGATGWTSENGMVEKVRKEAGKLGANGVILEAIQEPSAGAKVAGAFLGVAASRHGKVVAIRFTKPDPDKK